MKKGNLRYLTELALVVAIELAMRATGLTSIPVGPLVKSFATVPIAVGAMLLGPAAGGVLGLVFGCTSLYDAITGRSLMTNAFFLVSPVHTVILCVGMRVLMGVLAGLVFQAFRKLDRTDTVCYFLGGFCYFAGGLCTPLLNTLLFMGYIVLVFYQTAYVQERVAVLGATGPLMFVILSVGVQGLVEAVVGLVVGGGIAKGVAHALGGKLGKQRGTQAA